MILRILTLFTLLTLSACASDGSSKTEVFGEISGGIEHTIIK